MLNTPVLRRHAALVDRMADALGVDLEESMMRGKLEIGELGDAVLRCTGCAAPDACGQWLDSPAAKGADRTPGYCRNADLLASLAP